MELARLPKVRKNTMTARRESYGWVAGRGASRGAGRALFLFGSLRGLCGTGRLDGSRDVWCGGGRYY